jgi:hypothetical protein
VLCPACGLLRADLLFTAGTTRIRSVPEAVAEKTFSPSRLEG